MGPVHIRFLGATETVTGSRFLVSSDKTSILIDAGMFQGTHDIRRKNWDPFPVDPATIDAIVLTHAHLDHCGYLPLLVRNGFNKQIICTGYTEKLAAVILRDSARLQTEDANFAAEKGFSKHVKPLPLYDITDVEKTLGFFKPVGFRERIDLTSDAAVTFYPSGHILGSAYVILEIGGKTLLFSGDMGRDNHPLLSPPDNPPKIHIDAVITESTYGDRAHDTSVGLFAEEINQALKRGGSILIPAFAVDRTEVILMSLRELINSKVIPNVPIYVDSPMALTALDYYRDAVRTNALELRAGIAERWKSTDPFDPGNLTELRTVEQSKSINNLVESSIIISASGMATGGRVVHHLANMLPDPRNTVILVGFQAAGSRGRSLEEGKKEIKMYGKWIPVHAHISKVESFSVHADGNELIAWLRRIARPDQAFVVHGERDAQKIFAGRLESELGWNTIVPQAGASFVIG
jgi:metallo-beta-lactamase family protein